MIPQRVAIVAPFNSWSDSYSLCHVVKEQYEALRRLGWFVDVFVGTACGNVEGYPPSLNEIPLGSMKPDRPVPKEIEDLAGFFAQRLGDRYDVIIFHDIILQAHNVSAAMAVHAAAPSIRAVCLHYLHSRPHPDPKAPACRQTVPSGHFLVYPNGSDHAIDAVRSTYQHDPRRCFSIMNPCDPLNALGVSSGVRRILESVNWRARSLVQTYPVCSTRMKDKGVPHLLRLFDIFANNCGEQALLIVCNSHANGKAEQKAVDALMEEPVARSGNVVFTSRMGYPDNIPRAWVQELMRASDLFLFPTVSEAGPLIMLEAANAGCFIAHNGGWCPSLDYYAPPGSASFHLPPVDAIDNYALTMHGSQTVSLQGEKAYRAACHKIAREVLSAVKQSPSYQSRQFVKTQASLPAYGNSLKQIIVEARRIISHEPS